MLISCTTKGCLQQTEAKLNEQTGEVICEACENPIKNVTEFIKKALRDSKQVMRSPKTAFQAQCHQCRAAKPLYIDEGRAFCKTCGTQVHVTAAFLKGLEIHLKEEEKEE